MSAKCGLCPRGCVIEEGKTGFCRARTCRDGRVVCGNYGMVTSLALDPIEKKPLSRFFPGSRILSAGSYGCNLRCPFCQNHEISMRGGEQDAEYVSPERLCEIARGARLRGNIGAAFTYNEPLVGYEYVADAAKLIKAAGMKTVLVTNGYIRGGPFEELLEHIDALNIDLKGFTEDFYRTVGGDLETVKGNVALAARRAHVEVTTLVIPGLNDSEEDMRREAEWLASLDAGIVLHITRFFPRYMMKDRPPTPLETLRRLAAAARGYLPEVRLGNC